MSHLIHGFCTLAGSRVRSRESRQTMSRDTRQIDRDERNRRLRMLSAYVRLPISMGTQCLRRFASATYQAGVSETPLKTKSASYFAECSSMCPQVTDMSSLDSRGQRYHHLGKCCRSVTLEQIQQNSDDSPETVLLTW